IEVSDSSVGPSPMRVGSGRRMRSRRRVGRLPPTMSRRTFEVLDRLVVVVIAHATTTLSGILVPPGRHRAQEIGAKLRLMPVLFAAALASCEAGGPSGDGLPPLHEGFTYLTRVGGVIRNASMEGFNTDAVGLAISGDGSRVAALVMAGQFFQTFTTTTVYDWASGSYVSELGGGTSTNTSFTQHRRDYGGATWRELAVRPAHDAPTG